MRITYYRFPKEMPIRDCYMAWMEGEEDFETPPAWLTDDEVENEWPRQRVTNVRKAKKFLRKFGGVAFTEHIDRDGGCFEVTPIEAERSNKGIAYGAKYNRHL